ncbi:transcriptional regulator GcvA [Robbsia sp. Bb-Pol-6]|uniref:Transcriptional regulator GcvA n=1 Tax=Robbsia betulipollinis TaxID=2981849 RepID=A0ABT3ZRA4_9BURK|nr:transcriptional regulator GcvA [Robbsia betulipollinis]MCY0389091.1 transcriptional regulator GcvA [Robbsia betulipollinis]
MNLQHLPNLSALRAFEAAARLESFSQAASELFVTHGAVSHQIRGLETALQTPLFARLGKRVVLTEAGRRYATQIRAALHAIAAATEDLRGGRAQRLVVSVLPSFAARWLMPRIGRFIERHPDLDIEIRASSELVDFARSDVDVGLRHGRPMPTPGLHVETLIRDVYFPACSPSFKGGRRPATPAEMLSFGLLQSCGDEPWRLWFDAAGLHDAPEPVHGPRYLDSSHLLDAALRGQGIALVRSSLAADDLRAGRLLRLFDVDASSGALTRAVCPVALRETARVRAFFDWLTEEVRASDAAQPTPVGLSARASTERSSPSDDR